MKKSVKPLFLLVLLAVAGPLYAADTPRTPALGSAERVAICDAARYFVMKGYVSPAKLPQPMVFKVGKMEVLGNYCYFEALPLFKDGSPMGTDYIMDIEFALCLKSNHGKWQVIYDLSSTDVPDDKQLRKMWSAFPKDFPFALVPEFWREKFNRAKQ